MKPHLVCVGGEDHRLRIPFLLALQERGVRITTLSSGDPTPFTRAGIAHRGFEFDRFASSGGGLQALKAIRKAVLELRPDIVQSFDTKPNLLTALAVRGSAPVVRTINGLGWTFSSLEPRAMALRPVFCALQWLASRWTAATVFQNRDDMAFFQRFKMNGSSKITLIRSSGLDIDAFAKAKLSGPSASTMRDRLKLQSAEIIIFVGRLTRQKGILTLLQALPRIAAERPNARLLLVGPRDSEGPFAVDQSEIDHYGDRVIALGPRDDVPSLLGMADVFAFPTEYREGIPRVLLEAGLAGLPIVASNMPGCNDVIENGWNGYLIPPRNAEALASRIVSLLSDRACAKTMGGRSVELVRDRFPLALIVDQYFDLYKSILDTPSRTNPASQPSPSLLKDKSCRFRLDEARQ